jgi:hypothetical protein
MKIITAECLSEMFKTGHVYSSSAYSKRLPKVVHDLYVANEIRHLFLFVAVTYAI